MDVKRTLPSFRQQRKKIALPPLPKRKSSQNQPELLQEAPEEPQKAPEEPQKAPEEPQTRKKGASSPPWLLPGQQNARRTSVKANLPELVSKGRRGSSGSSRSSRSSGSSGSVRTPPVPVAKGICVVGKDGSFSRRSLSLQRPSPAWPIDRMADLDRMAPPKPVEPYTLLQRFATVNRFVAPRILLNLAFFLYTAGAREASVGMLFTEMIHVATQLANLATSYAKDHLGPSLTLMWRLVDVGTPMLVKNMVKKAVEVTVKVSRTGNNAVESIDLFSTLMRTVTRRSCLPANRKDLDLALLGLLDYCDQTEREYSHHYTDATKGVEKLLGDRILMGSNQELTPLAAFVRIVAYCNDDAHFLSLFGTLATQLAGHVEAREGPEAAREGPEAAAALDVKILHDFLTRYDNTLTFYQLNSVEGNKYAAATTFTGSSAASASDASEPTVPPAAGDAGVVAVVLDGIEQKWKGLEQKWKKLKRRWPKTTFGVALGVNCVCQLMDTRIHIALKNWTTMLSCVVEQEMGLDRFMQRASVLCLLVARVVALKTEALREAGQDVDECMIALQKMCSVFNYACALSGLVPVGVPRPPLKAPAIVRICSLSAALYEIRVATDADVEATKAAVAKEAETILSIPLDQQVDADAVADAEDAATLAAFSEMIGEAAGKILHDTDTVFERFEFNVDACEQMSTVLRKEFDDGYLYGAEEEEPPEAAEVPREEAAAAAPFLWGHARRPLVRSDAFAIDRGLTLDERNTPLLRRLVQPVVPELRYACAEHRNGKTMAAFDRCIDDLFYPLQPPPNAPKDQVVTGSARPLRWIPAPLRPPLRVDEALRESVVAAAGADEAFREALRRALADPEQASRSSWFLGRMEWGDADVLSMVDAVLTKNFFRDDPHVVKVFVYLPVDVACPIVVLGREGGRPATRDLPEYTVIQVVRVPRPPGSADPLQDPEDGAFFCSSAPSLALERLKCLPDEDIHRLCRTAKTRRLDNDMTNPYEIVSSKAVRERAKADQTPYEYTTDFALWAPTHRLDGMMLLMPDRQVRLRLWRRGTSRHVVQNIGSKLLLRNEVERNIAYFEATVVPAERRVHRVNGRPAYLFWIDQWRSGKDPNVALILCYHDAPERLEALLARPAATATRKAATAAAVAAAASAPDPDSRDRGEWRAVMARYAGNGAWTSEYLWNHRSTLVALARPASVEEGTGTVGNVRARHCIQKLEEMDPADMGDRLLAPVGRIEAGVVRGVKTVMNVLADIVRKTDVAAENRARLEQGYRTTVGIELRKNLVSDPSVLVERARTTNVLYVRLRLWSPSDVNSRHETEYYPATVRVDARKEGVYPAHTTEGVPFLYWVEQDGCVYPDVALLLCYFPIKKKGSPAGWRAFMTRIVEDEWQPSTQLWPQGQATNVSFDTSSTFAGGRRIARRKKKAASKTSKTSKAPKASKASKASKTSKAIATKGT
jgi:hypothetical protein